MTKQQKLNQCRAVIITYLEAMGPGEYKDIFREVMTQAIAPGYMTKAMNQLKNEGRIYYDVEVDSFDIL